MLSVNRRRFLQLSASSAVAAYWGTACSSTAQPQLVSEILSPATENITSGSQPAQEEGRAAGGLLRIALSALPNSLDPASFAIVEAYPFGFAVYDGLVWVDATLTSQPMLAESWKSSADQLSWLFTLRRDVAFHHGTLLTSTDVVYTFTRLLDPAQDSILQSILNFVDYVEAVDNHTVRFQLSTPNADFPFLLAAPQARILASDYPTERLLTKPSGTGPFLFVELVAGERIIYARNPDYWAAERIHLDELHHIYIPSFDAQITALMQGEVELLLDVAGDAIEPLTANPNTRVVEIGSGRYQNLAMRVTEPPFHDVRVRQALKACIDRSALRQQMLRGHGELGNDHPVASLSPFFADLPLQFPDLEKARQLLTEAGYEAGLQLQLITSAAAPGMVEVARAVQTMVEPVGITIEVVEVKVPPDIYFADYWGRVPFYVSAWEFRPSIYETFAIAYHSQSVWNETGWSSPELDKALDAARSTLDPEKRKALYKTAAQLLMNEGAVIIPYFQPVLTAMRANVQDFQPHPAGWVDLRDVWIT